MQSVIGTVAWSPNEFESGAHVRRKKNFFGRAPPLFGSTSAINRFCERFIMVSTVWLFSFSCYSTHGAPCVQPFVKVPPCPMESAPLYGLSRKTFVADWSTRTQHFFYYAKTNTNFLYTKAHSLTPTKRNRILTVYSVV